MEKKESVRTKKREDEKQKLRTSMGSKWNLTKILRNWGLEINFKFDYKKLNFGIKMKFD